MKSSVGQRYQGRQPSRRTNDILNGDMGIEQDQVSDYEENDQDGEEDDIEDDEVEEDEEDEFFQQRMPEQHPAIRTTVQLMGNSPISHSFIWACRLIHTAELMDGDRPYLDLNPHYQRNVVWTRKAKQMLIDSMFGGFFVPPVRFEKIRSIWVTLTETGDFQCYPSCGRERRCEIQADLCRREAGKQPVCALWDRG